MENTMSEPIELIFINHQKLYRAIPTFILWAIRAKHFFVGHEGYLHESRRYFSRYCTACKRQI